jgi:hypothetical protein
MEGTLKERCVAGIIFHQQKERLVSHNSQQ